MKLLLIDNRISGLTVGKFEKGEIFGTYKGELIRAPYKCLLYKQVFEEVSKGIPAQLFIKRRFL